MLLVDGDHQEWLRGDTDFFKLALTPFEEIRDKNSKEPIPAVEMKDLIKATSLTIDEFAKINSLAEYSSLFWLISKSLNPQRPRK